MNTAGHCCSLAIVTYATNSSTHYSAYAVAINTIYALTHGYRMVVLGDQLGVKYAHESTADPRWNKISILQASLDAESGWARDCDYVLWLDSDLVVLDVTLDFTEIGARHPHADIIMSRDMASAAVVSNSGAVLVRNTDWARDVLRMWWSTFDKDRCCDQNAFTWLYDSDTPMDIKQRTALLPADAMNTDFPAWKNQQPHNPILHLAGLTSLYRVEVFRAGYQTVCAALLDLQSTHENSPVPAPALKEATPPQLGLTKHFLFSTMRSLNDMRSLALDELISDSAAHVADCIEPLCRGSPWTVACYHRDSSSSEGDESEDAVGDGDGVCKDGSAEAQSWRQRLEDVMKMDDDEKEYYTPSDFANIATLRAKEVLIRERIFCMLHQVTSSQCSSVGIVQEPPALEHLEAVREAASTGFELVIALNSWERSAHTTADVGRRKQQLVLDLVTRLLDTTALTFWEHMSNQIQGIFHYYKFKALQLMAGAYQIGNNLSSNPPASIILLSQAAQSWEETVVHNYRHIGYVSADPDKEYVAVLGELALLQCIEQHHELGQVTFAKVIELQKRTLRDYSTFRIATADIVKAGKISLIESYLNYAQCILDSQARHGEGTAAHLARLALDVSEGCDLRESDRRKVRAQRIIDQVNSGRGAAVRRKLKRKVF